MQQRLFLISIFSLLVVIGCDKDDLDSSTIASTLSGDVTTFVSLYDSIGNPIQNMSGVTITDLTSGKSGITNDSGKCIITGLPAGSHVLTFSKPGFASTKIFGHQIPGPGMTFLNGVILSQPPISAITNDSIQFIVFPDKSGATFNLWGKYPTSFINTQVASIVCVSTDSSALANNPAMAPNVHLVTNYAQANQYQAYYSDQIPAKGGKLFITICILGQLNEYSVFFDPNTNRMFYPSAGPHSPILSVTIP